ncbi:CYTH-like domain-containing protein [Chaetomium tenue]|uniref:CYTH-like domain-containing protein n=1 Tax=Chaetomium tenue TaxID=1854479 RepID=A0ACB7P5G0_9PEZI|nr:CYTH-like domain-containing protein [Chaetomium globosum]
MATTALRTTRALFTTLPQITTPNPTPKTILEVERKFRRLTVPTLTGLTTTTPHPQPPHLDHHPLFHTVHPLPRLTLHDTYYDTPHHALSLAGAWIRRRNGAWEAKVRKGGDFVNSRFEELRGEAEVRKCVSRVLGRGVRHEGGEGEDFGLGVMAELVTVREGWVVDGEFRVVRDVVGLGGGIGHEVGEVELQVEVEGEVGEGEKGVMMEGMDRRVEEFMQRYAWAWERGEVVGKLAAYFEMLERRGGAEV